MDALLIPVFIFTVLLLAFFCIMFLLYVVPVRFSVAVTFRQSEAAYTVGASWGLIGIRIIEEGDCRITVVTIGGQSVHAKKGIRIAGTT